MFASVLPPTHTLDVTEVGILTLTELKLDRTGNYKLEHRAVGAGAGCGGQGNSDDSVAATGIMSIL